MSIAQNDVIQLVNGLLADPGTSSKDTQRVVAEAVKLYKEIEFQVKKENDRLNQVAAAASKKETAGKTEHKE